MKEYQVINILEGIYEEYVRDNDKDYIERNTALTEAVKALTEIQYYRAIGAVEECREARERQRGKKPVIGNGNGRPRKCCSVCGCFYSPTSKYCPKFGQGISREGEQ